MPRLSLLTHGPGWGTEAPGGQGTCPGPLSRGIPQCQDLLLCRLHAPSWLVHTVCTPAVCQQSLLPLTSSRNQEPELVFGAGRSCRRQSGQEKPLRAGGIWAKSCGMRGSQSCEGRKRVNWVEAPAEAGAWRWDRGFFSGKSDEGRGLQGLRGRGRVSDAAAKSGA